MTERIKINPFLMFISILMILAMVGCTSANQTPTATATPSATAIPPTPTPSPAELIWVNPQSTSADAVSQTINEFASANALQVRKLTAVTSADINSGTKIVVMSGVPADLTSLAAAAPAAQWIVLGNDVPTGINNISSIQSKPEDEAFMAGYLTMLISQDWRAGALLTSDGPIGSAYVDDFANGSKFVCGQCNPFYSPIVSFPVIAAEPAASPSTTWTADADRLSQNWLSAAYITPSAALPEVLAAISARTINIDTVNFISTTAAPNDGQIPWVALLDVDYASALKTLLPQVLLGQGNLTARAQITLTNINEDIITPGKQTLFNQTAAALAADQILPSTVQ
ncbi:MAG: hypothetical protein AB9897_04380 [Anaerolineaceae bacterium]